jgi:hypothetical protein
MRCRLHPCQLLLPPATRSARSHSRRDGGLPHGPSLAAVHPQRTQALVLKAYVRLTACPDYEIGCRPSWSVGSPSTSSPAGGTGITLAAWAPTSPTTPPHGSPSPASSGWARAQERPWPNQLVTGDRRPGGALVGERTDPRAALAKSTSVQELRQLTLKTWWWCLDGRLCRW